MTKPNKGKLRRKQEKGSESRQDPQKKVRFSNPPLANPHTGAFLYYRVLMPMSNCSIQRKKDDRKNHNLGVGRKRKEKTHTSPALKIDL